MSLLAEGARAGDTAADVRRREGASTIGLWLPLALASLVQCVCGIGGSPPDRSEILQSFALPELARAVRRDEDDARRDGLEAWVDGIRRRFGKG